MTARGFRLLLRVKWPPTGSGPAISSRPGGTTAATRTITLTAPKAARLQTRRTAASESSSARALLWLPKLCSHHGINPICGRKRVLTTHTDDAEKPRG
jgi:hypothetical protein